MNNPNIWSHLPKLKFDDMSDEQKDHARATFFDAHSDDGYTYVIGSDGIPFCRNR